MVFSERFTLKQKLLKNTKEIKRIINIIERKMQKIMSPRMKRNIVLLNHNTLRNTEYDDYDALLMM